MKITFDQAAKVLESCKVVFFEDFDTPIIYNNFNPDKKNVIEFVMDGELFECNRTDNEMVEATGNCLVLIDLNGETCTVCPLVLTEISTLL